MEWLNSAISHFSLNPTHLFLLLFIIALSKSTVMLSSFLPPASVMLLATITLNQSSLHPVMMWLAVLSGATSGSILNYHIGHLLGPTRAVDHLMAKHADKLIRVQSQLNQNGTVVLFTARFLAVLRYFVPLTAGILGFNAIKFYTISLISASVWAALYVGGVVTFNLF